MEGDLHEVQAEFEKLKTAHDKYLETVDELSDEVSQLRDDLKNAAITEEVLKEEIESKCKYYNYGEVCWSIREISERYLLLGVFLVFFKQCIQHVFIKLH